MMCVHDFDALHNYVGKDTRDIDGSTDPVFTSVEKEGRSKVVVCWMTYVFVSFCLWSVCVHIQGDTIFWNLKDFFC